MSGLGRGRWERGTAIDPPAADPGGVRPSGHGGGASSGQHFGQDRPAQVRPDEQPSQMWSEDRGPCRANSEATQDTTHDRQPEGKMMEIWSPS